MNKVTKVNCEGEDYGFVAGNALKGVSGASASDYVKTVVLAEGADLVEGCLLLVTFANGNTAGFYGTKTVYSSNGTTFYYDQAMTDPVTLPVAGCYTITPVAGNEYLYQAFPVLSVNGVVAPFCDSKGHPYGGAAWSAGDSVTMLYMGDKFVAILSTINQVVAGVDIPPTSDAVYQAIAGAVNGLDVASVGGSGKYISAISETNGKISATASNLATTVESGNNQPVTSNGVAAAMAYDFSYYVGQEQTVFIIKVPYVNNSNNTKEGCIIINSRYGYKYMLDYYTFINEANISGTAPTVARFRMLDGANPSGNFLETKLKWDVDTTNRKVIFYIKKTSQNARLTFKVLDNYSKIDEIEFGTTTDTSIWNNAQYSSDLEYLSPINSVESGNLKPVTSDSVFPIKQEIERLYTTNNLFRVIKLPTVAYYDLPSQSIDTETYFKEWLDYMNTNGYLGNRLCIYLATAIPNSTGIVIGYTYNDTDALRYCAFIHLAYNKYIRFGYNNNNWFFTQM